MALSSKNIKRVAIGLAAASTLALSGVAPAAAESSETTAAAPATTAAPTTTAAPEKAGYSLDLKLEAGTTCVVTVRNQFSVHPGTNVEVTVGDKVYVIEDVEAEAEKVSTSEAITVGDNGATVFVAFGEDGLSSLKSQDVSCEAPKPAPVVATPTYTG